MDTEFELVHRNCNEKNTCGGSGATEKGASIATNKAHTRPKLDPHPQQLRDHPDLRNHGHHRDQRYQQQNTAARTLFDLDDAVRSAEQAARLLAPLPAADKAITSTSCSRRTPIVGAVRVKPCATLRKHKFHQESHDKRHTAGDSWEF